jgi:AraC-like DNA-binding protein
MGRSLQAGLGERTACPLDGPEVEARAPALRRLLAAPDLTAARRAGDDLGAGVGIQAPCAPIDRRVLSVLRQLGSGFREATPVAAYAASVHLSESRFAHLFRRQVGLPLRSYRRWLRLRAALALSLAGDDLTTAAHDAGFADLPDFSRLCRSTFGVPPSRLSRHTAHFEAAVAGYPIRSDPGCS